MLGVLINCEPMSGASTNRMLGVSLSGLVIASSSWLGKLEETEGLVCVGMAAPRLGYRAERGRAGAFAGPVGLAGCVSLGWQLSHALGHTALYPGEDSSSFTCCLSFPSCIDLPGIGCFKRDQASMNFVFCLVRCWTVLEKQW